MARPKFEPTAENKRTVEILAACGTLEDKIALVIGPKGIDAKTLRKHFRHELDTAAIKANAKVAQTLYQMATSGKCPAATFFWLKTRAGWKENGNVAQPVPGGGPVAIDDAHKKLAELISRRADNRRDLGLANLFKQQPKTQGVPAPSLVEQRSTAAEGERASRVDPGGSRVQQDAQPGGLGPRAGRESVVQADSACGGVSGRRPERDG